MTDLARAFVPGHVTGFFSVEEDDDPTKAGSRGAGIVLSAGATVTVQPADRRQVLLNGESTEMAPVERVLDALQATAEVQIATDLPVGAGFGVSGAASLGAALAANAAFDRQLSENELCTIAHGAEVVAGTGLGDVVAQHRGGVPIRLEPGAPRHAVLDGIPRRARVEFVSFGERSTEAVIETGDTTDASSHTEDDAETFDRQALITRTGREALSRVVSEPTLASFVYASRRFARETDLLTERVRSTIRDVSAVDGEASMAMLGETVFALGTGLTDAGYDPTVTTTSATGATLLSEPRG